MEWLIAIIIGIGIVWLIFVRRDKSFDNPSKTSDNDYGDREQFASFDDDDDDGFGENVVWETRHFKDGALGRPKNFVVLSGFSNLRIAGSSNYFDTVKGLVSEDFSAATRVTLEREPNNPHDNNAISVWLEKFGNNQRTKIGYVPRGDAEKIAKTFMSTMPILGELRSAGFHSREKAAFVSINILGPKAKDRAAFLIGDSS